MSLFGDMFRLPLHLVGLKDIPAVPVDLAEMAETLLKLDTRAKETQQAMQGLTGTYSIGDVTALGYDFLFGGQPADTSAAAARERLRHVLSANPLEVGKAVADKILHEAHGLLDAVGGRQEQASDLTTLSLDRPDQFTMSWTTLPDVAALGRPFLPRFTGSLVDAERATADFWPTIAEFGLPFNLILPQKLGEADGAELPVAAQRRDLSAPHAGSDRRRPG